MDKPKMRIGDLFYSQGKRWEVVDSPFLEDSVEGVQWWYPSRVIGMTNIKESLVDSEENNDEPD